MMKVLMLLLLLAASRAGVCQLVAPASIYEVGREVRTAEDNFVNLFANWREEYVAGADSLRLEGYGFCEVIGDAGRKEAYWDSITMAGYPSGWLIETMGLREEQASLEWKFFEREACMPEEEMGVVKRGYYFCCLKDYYDYVVPLGTRVYRLSLVYGAEGKRYALFVFVDPDNRVEDFYFTVLPVEFWLGRKPVVAGGWSKVE